MFINRERELGFLRGAWKEPRAQFIVIYGKRRVGKTELVKQFFKEVPHIYYLADKASESDQLKMLFEKVGRTGQNGTEGLLCPLQQKGLYR